MSLADSSGTSSVADESWVNWFCGLSGHHVFCEVDRQFIEDSFNLFGLKQFVNKDFNKALAAILDRTDSEPEEDMDIDTSAAMLYGLIHARFIITTNGLQAMQKKYLQNEFGECPRAYCQNQPVLPVGLSDDPSLGCYKLFCPRCRELYHCPDNQRHVDGAYFGTSFAHIFLMTFDELVPTVPSGAYVPRVFGFKVHASSNSLPKKVVVLDLNSQSDANSSNPLASSGDSEKDKGHTNTNTKVALNNSHNSSNGGNGAPRTSSSGVPVVYDLTASSLQQSGAALAEASKVGGNPRLSLQPPGHAKYQHPYQADQGAPGADGYYPAPGAQYSAGQYASPQFAHQYAPPRQQEYPPEAYYHALARHHGGPGGAPVPNGYPAPQPPMPGNGAYSEYGQYVTYGYTAPPGYAHPGPGPRQGPGAHSPRADAEDDPAKRPRTHL